MPRSLYQSVSGLSTFPPDEAQSRAAAGQPASAVCLAGRQGSPRNTSGGRAERRVLEAWLLTVHSGGRTAPQHSASQNWPEPYLARLVGLPHECYHRPQSPVGIGPTRAGTARAWTAGSSVLFCNPPPVNAYQPTRAAFSGNGFGSAAAQRKRCAWQGLLETAPALLVDDEHSPAAHDRRGRRRDGSFRSPRGYGE